MELLTEVKKLKEEISSHNKSLSFFEIVVATMMILFLLYTLLNYFDTGKPIRDLISKSYN